VGGAPPPRSRHHAIKPSQPAYIEPNASRRTRNHTAANRGKAWNYALIPDDVVDENMSLDYLLNAGPAA
jgi:hypothetical protein